MSIKEIKICLESRLRKKGKINIIKTLSQKTKLNNEDIEILSILNKEICIGDLSKFFKKEVNYILKKVLDWEDLGIVHLKLSCEDSNLKCIYEEPYSAIDILKRRPDICNIVAYEREWRKYPTVFDFLAKNSEFYKLKDFEKEIYFNLMGSFLSQLPNKATILDAGGGIGRFACEFVKRGYKVHLLDSSRMALRRALRHLLQQKKTVNFDLHWGDVANLSMFSDATFDGTFAIELICYCINPKKILKELIRVTKNGGLIIVSVEGKYGGMLSDHNVSLGKIIKIFKSNLLYIKNHLYVHYYTPETLYKLLEECGIEVLNIFGCHYLAEGILHRLLKENKLDNKKDWKKLMKIEEFCQKDPVLNKLARAWVAVGRKR